MKIYIWEIRGYQKLKNPARRESVRASGSKVMDIRIAATETTRETAAGKDKIKEQDELLKKRVKQLHGIDRRIKESARRIASEYTNLKKAKNNMIVFLDYFFNYHPNRNNARQHMQSTRRC